MNVEQKKTEENGRSQKDLHQEAENLSGLSEEQLMQRLCEEVQKQKQDGRFNYDALVLSLQKVLPFIDEASFEKLMYIVESLK